MLCVADPKESSAEMPHLHGRLPVVWSISALSLGAPLVVVGVASMLSDLAEILQIRGLAATQHFGLGLGLGPMFAVVGLSFLWPLRLSYSNH